MDFWISAWISGFQFGFLPTVYEISFVTDPSALVSNRDAPETGYGGGPPCCLVECSPSIHVTEKELAIIQLDNSIVNNFYRQSQASSLSL